MMGQRKCPQLPEHVGLAHKAGGVERTGDDAHGFLRVVAAMAEAVGGGGEQLQLAEQSVDGLRRLVPQNPVSRS